ncbi:sce7726 family protein [Thiomicrospira pelophila]|uniref:sce7726 family protein n=1 Tax=Thiomicrospira pelophila TaxID=934 RepID=UPI00138E2642|nr:sce7726 family protein [Thiomicrospira pelophila]
MNDPEIRQLLFKHLTRRKSIGETDIYEEVPLRTGQVRADIVLIGSYLECFEIKGPNDTLKRLLDQGNQYQETFEKIHLVCATKHINKVIHMVPKWWGIIEITQSGQVKNIQKAKNNPKRKIQGLVDLLHVDEAKNILKNSTHLGVSKLNHSHLRELLVEHLSEIELRVKIRQELAKRKWRWLPSQNAINQPHLNARTWAI